jgi:L-lactate dehydrogenase complex protein LldF
MQINSNQFVALADIALNDEALQASVTTGTTNAYTKRIVAMGETSPAHGEALRRQAAAAKRAALHRLPDLLEQAEANLQANGAVVYWATDAAEANRLVLEIAKRHGVRKVAKSKSMVTEETSLNSALEADGIAAIETDLGEYILQLNNEPPSHIVTPVIHKSKASIRDIFVDKIGMVPTDDAATMAHYAGTQLRQDFLTADMGVSGGNFIIAETGTVCLVTNEGNGRLVTSIPPVHVAVVGIEKIVATLEDYATLTQVLPRSATGQKLTVYTSMLNGPRRADDSDGPEHVYVILVDNGRTGMYAGEYAEALACIRCGACLNACPVYQVTGGHSYGWVYPGPIGAIVTPLLKGLDHASPLPFASTLCGNCQAVCPVAIDIPRMLLSLRRDVVAKGKGGAGWSAGMKAWAQGMASPTLYRIGGRSVALMMRGGAPRRMPGVLGGWTKYRTFPRFAKQSFRDQWKNRRKNN